MANLVLNGRSIDSIDDIAKNFVEADVLREFQSGSLATWLEEYDYEDELARIRAIKPTASNIRVLSGIIEALNLDDDVIAQANIKRETQQRKEDAARKVREEQQKREEEERRRKEVEERKRLKEEAELRECENRRKYEAERQREELEERRRREREDKERQEREETQRLLNMDLKKVSAAKSPQEAFEIYKKAADAGNVHAAAYLARCYYDGKGVEKDLKSAIYWAEVGAKRNDTSMQFFLGERYHWDLDDCSVAMKWYRMAAEHGDAEAQLKLAYMYKYGDVEVAVDKRESAKWMSMLIEQVKQGNAEAEFHLGMEYLNQFGCNNTVAKPNKSKGVQLIRKAAEQGHAEAQFNLGNCYCGGVGVVQDLEEARKWWDKAAKQGLVGLTIP